MVNQKTPYGSINYDETGKASTGAPTYTATTSLSPELQSLVGTGIQNAQGNANLESGLLSNVANTANKPLDLSYGATEANLDALGRQTLDPQFQQGQDQLQQKLYSQGLRPGQESYDNQMTSFNNNKNAAYNNLYLTGHQQAVNDITQQYNSPLNALSALRSNSQVSQPGVGQTAATPQTGVQGTNVAGIVQNAYQQQQQAASATMGGLFGLGGAGLGAVGNAGGMAAFFSDRRVKHSIRQIGRLANGLPVYRFKYIWGGPEQIGLMAQDVEQVHPEAVFEVDGIKAVNYDLAVR